MALLQNLQLFRNDSFGILWYVFAVIYTVICMRFVNKPISKLQKVTLRHIAYCHRTSHQSFSAHNAPSISLHSALPQPPWDSATPMARLALPRRYGNFGDRSAFVMWPWPLTPCIASPHIFDFEVCGLHCIENYRNCCHLMWYFKTKRQQIRFRLGLRSRPR